MVQVPLALAGHGHTAAHIPTSMLFSSLLAMFLRHRVASRTTLSLALPRRPTSVSRPPRSRTRICRGDAVWAHGRREGPVASATSTTQADYFYGGLQGVRPPAPK